MQQEVFADLYVLVNAGMDLLCFMITAVLMHRKILRRRAIPAAILGGLYALGILLIGAGGTGAVALDLFAMLLMCAIVFYSRGERFFSLLKITAVNVMVSAFLGGIMTALYAWLNRLDLPMEVLEGDGISVWIFAILAAVSGFLTARGGMFFGISRKTRSVTVEAILFGMPVTLSAMVDSGNFLKDPMGGRGVIVVERQKIAHALPKNFPKEGELNQSVELATKLRLIPTKTATGGGILEAIVPDELVIVDQDGRHRADYLIAPISLGESARGFDALIPFE